MTKTYDAPELPKGYYFNVEQQKNYPNYLTISIRESPRWLRWLYYRTIAENEFNVNEIGDLAANVHDRMVRLKNQFNGLREAQRIRFNKDAELQATVSTVVGSYPPKKVVG